MKTLIVFPKGAISAKDKERLSKNGFCPIEAEDPSKIVMPDFTPTVQTKDVLLCMAEAALGGHAGTELGIKTRAFDGLMKRIIRNADTLKPKEATP